MLVRYHEPYGDPERPQHPLPENWEEIASKAGRKPKRFGVVDPRKLYRSGIIWSHQVPILQEEYNIKNIISLIEGNWLKDFYEDKEITIHQFPFYQRRELTFERVKNIVDVINSLEEPAIIHCFTGATRTGLVSAGYNIINGKKSKLATIIENLKYKDINFSSWREILKY